MSYTPKQLGHLVMRVRDLDRSVDFYYTRIMGLTIMEQSPSGTVFMSATSRSPTNWRSGPSASMLPGRTAQS